VPEAKAVQSIVSVAEGAKPKKANPTQKAPKKAKVVVPKAVVPTAEIVAPVLANLPSVNIWPSWVENLLGIFGKKKK
jgi:hypothetical protein